MEVVVHWSAFEDGSWACGGEWPPVVSKRPLVLGPDYPRISLRAAEVTCVACRRWAKRVVGT
jgi:hypothetical protein